MCLGKIPQGESRAEFDERVSKAFESIVDGCDDDDDIALVVHGGTIMSIMGAFNDDCKGYFEYHVANCEMILCELERAVANQSPDCQRSLVLHRID